MSRHDHILHARVGRDGQWVTLECAGEVGTGEHISVNAEAWDWRDTAVMAEHEAAGRVDRSRCWVQDWIENDGADCLVGPDEWPGDGPWPVVCSFDGDRMIVELAEAQP